MTRISQHGAILRRIEMIEWHYVKDEPIPKDGKLRTVAYHSDKEEYK